MSQWWQRCPQRHQRRHQSLHFLPSRPPLFPFQLHCSTSCTNANAAISAAYYGGQSSSVGREGKRYGRVGQESRRRVFVILSQKPERRRACACLACVTPAPSLPLVRASAPLMPHYPQIRAEFTCIHDAPRARPHERDPPGLLRLEKNGRYRLLSGEQGRPRWRAVGTRGL